MNENKSRRVHIRTKDGIIGRVKDLRSVIKIGVYIDNLHFDGIGELTNSVLRENIVKHSDNIIDLVDVGDYVNGCKVDEVRSSYYVYMSDYDIEIREQEIKSIVTKEQFKRVKYVF